MLARSENKALKQEYLPKMGNGERLVGIGLCHRMRGRVADDAGLSPWTAATGLMGPCLWVTGYDFFRSFRGPCCRMGRRFSRLFRSADRCL